MTKQELIHAKINYKSWFSPCDRMFQGITRFNIPNYSLDLNQPIYLYPNFVKKSKKDNFKNKF